ncbi:MAG: 16S rRNA (cytidine(1402)-2'-O)-methyltransferase [Anaerolineales bacterium]|jgi:16S rRNA (cytidine1402-2'-O)-methyltransferase|nr:16S rRNA (cytidine(1402)-2'-O)-methyltransferase [Chloroflexota bacterium]MBK6646450.1 16S rRNA (cytidine(1402)-2'-O)-methyltransferase [Anaerolineales bacterium]MCC6985920.1 16S rRNA (cytidine(1402)-2'-O)-methyltransferase [Anaerolineales bacterium]
MGTLYLVATPIGNLDDISPRALKVLREAVLIAAEDTRHTGKLLERFGIKNKLTSYWEHNKLNKLDFILDHLSQGDVALVSDAGTPGINDPGYELARAALASSFDVIPVPGPSAPIAALSASGLASDSFLYLGFLPHKSGERRNFVEQVANLPHTLIFLETPHRIADSLEDLLAVLGDRRICVAREMTKLHEEYWRGTVSGAVEHFKSKEPRGEFTLVIEGRAKVGNEQWEEDELLKALEEGLKAGKSAKELSAELAGPSGWNKKEVYEKVNSLKGKRRA